MVLTRHARIICGLCFFVVLAACGGGGGGTNTDPPSGFNPPPPPPSSQQPPPSTSPQPPPSSPPVMPSGSVTFETNAVTFATTVRNVTPPEQSIAFTLNGVPNGTPSYRADVNGDGVDFVSVQFTDGTGVLRITPWSARRLNVGVTTATITVSICIDDSNCSIGLMVGQPQTITVTYKVTPSVQGDVVSPRVAVANQPGDVVIRGRGFTGATSVRFGSMPASAMTVVNDSEIRASYPALAPGRYPVAINSGAIAFTGTVNAVNVPSYAAATLAFPSAPQELSALLYDPERNALLAAARYEKREDDQLIRFTYSGGQWSAPVSISVPGITDLAFSPDGSTLLVATERALVEYDPSTLTAGASFSPTDAVFTRPDVFFRSLGIPNDGYVVLSTITTAPIPGPLYVYSTQDHTFTLIDDLLTQQNNGIIGASASGSFVALMPSADSSVSRVLMYDGSQQRFSSLFNAPVYTSLRRNRSARPALDRAGTLSILNAATDSFTLNSTFSNTVVYDNKTAQRIGRLPVNTAAMVLKPDATRAYALQFDILPDEVVELRTYDLTQRLANSEAEYPQIGTALPLSLKRTVREAFAMVATPDASTLFLGSSFGVIVQPTPQ
jgi:IPT/TIG domain